MNNPNILWAQNRKVIFITVNILNIKKQKIEFTDESVKIVGENNEGNFNVQLNLNCKIIPENSSWSVNQRNLKLNIVKEKHIFVNKLTKQKQNNIKIDWGKWVNEDSSDSEEENNMINNFNEFKKQLPDEVLNQNFSELLDDNDLNIEDNSDDKNISEGIELETEDTNNEVSNDILLDNIDELNDDEIIDNDASCEMSNSFEIVDDDKLKNFKAEPITNLDVEELSLEEIN